MADNKEIITCPACGKYMAKIYLKHINKNIDICLEGCGGIYFDNREFELFDEVDENMEDIETFYDDENIVFKPANDEDKRICPNCNAPMVKTGNGTPQNNFKIDCCYTCGAKFLDGYELQKIRKACGTEEERSAYFNEQFKAKFGSDIEKLEKRHKKIKPDKNILRNILVDIITLNSSKDNMEFIEKYDKILNKHE